MNQAANDKELIENIKAQFGLKLPHMDTVQEVLKKLDVYHLEEFLVELVKTLVKRKVLKAPAGMKGHHLIAIDGTGNGGASADDHGTLSKESKNGTKSYYRMVLVATVVTPFGLSIPVAVEWVQSADGAEKQDCEQNAFKRLADKIKSYFPRLPICILADGLYANESVFEVCKIFQWEFGIVLKDKCLTTVWNQIENVLKSAKTDYSIKETVKKGKTPVFRSMDWVNGIKYRKNTLSWIEITEQNGKKEHYFSVLLSFEIDSGTVRSIATAVRSRWNIEEAFNNQKNNGFGSMHKFSRKSFVAHQNWYSLMLIADLFNQLTILAKAFKGICDRSNDTVIGFWKIFIQVLALKDFVAVGFQPKVQIRYQS